jgi:hypothetical protein
VDRKEVIHMATTETTKEILVRTIGQENPREIQLELEPGTLVSDVLEQAGLLGWRLVNPRGGNFQPGDRLYESVESGQKVLAVKVDDLSAGT